MKRLFILSTVALMVALFASNSRADLLINPGFEDLDGDGSQGDGWGSFGAAGFNAFFGDNGHASFFLDNPDNAGGVFQTGIAGTAGVEYNFSLDDVLIESNAAATEFNFGLEFYLADDTTLISSSLIALPLELPGGGQSFSFSAFAPDGTAFVRPIISFSGADGSADGSENVFVFGSTLTATAVPEPSTAALFAAASCVTVMRRRRRKA